MKRTTVLNTILLVCVVLACVLGVIALCARQLDPGAEAPAASLISPEDEAAYARFLRANN